MTERLAIGLLTIAVGYLLGYTFGLARQLRITRAELKALGDVVRVLDNHDRQGFSNSRRRGGP